MLLDLIETDSLLIARPRGTLDAALAEEIVAFVEMKEEMHGIGFNRFCDLTRLKGIQLLSEDVRLMADRRRWFNPNSIAVKSAFFATDPLAFGIARMYEQLLMSARIEVTVWDRMEGAADWLGVAVDRLKRSPCPEPDPLIRP
jgi:hypothetical protein